MRLYCRYTREMRIRAFLLIVAVAITLDAAPRRRAVSKPSIDPSTPETWLAQNAHVLLDDQPVPYLHDLAPLRDMIGSASVVGIGDGTHGTREFYTMKMRVIEFLAREMNFDLVALEGPFPLINRMNAYVQGGPGDARALVHAMRSLNYMFFNAEEIVELLEWMRRYNATRGERPPLQLAGFDVFEPYGASRDVLAYLQTVDGPAAANAETLYSCIGATQLVVNGECGANAASVFQALRLKEAEYSARTTAAAYHDALQSARVVVQNATPVGSERDDAMAANALWLREHHSATKKILLWAHNAHIAKIDTPFIAWRPMGQDLKNAIGDQYYAIGTLTAAGSFLQWALLTLQTKTVTFPALQPTDLETDLRRHGASRLLIPLRDAPPWLAAVRDYNMADAGNQIAAKAALPPQFDAVIFLDRTTPIHELTD